MKKIQGFTLIELMMVVSIIGVLSWIAVPKFQNYMLKATASTQLISAIRPIQNAISEYVAYHGDLPSTLTDLATVNFVNNSGVAFSSDEEFANGAVSAISFTFPTNNNDELLLAISFNCTEITVNGCSKIAPKALRDLTLDLSTSLQNNGSIRYYIDATKENNLAFKGFLPQL